MLCLKSGFICLLDWSYGTLITARGNEEVLFLYKGDGEIQLKIDYKAELSGTGIFLLHWISAFHRPRRNLLPENGEFFILLSIIKCSWLNDCGGH